MKCIYEGTGSSDESILSRVNMPNSDLQDRLCRLENLMESMAGASISDTASQNGTPSMARTPYVLFDRISSQPEELGKTVFGQLSSVYVDPSAWVHSFSQVRLTLMSHARSDFIYRSSSCLTILTALNHAKHCLFRHLPTSFSASIPVLRHRMLTFTLQSSKASSS